MTEKEYKLIRKNKGFLYLYFKEETKSVIPEVAFWQTLGFWLSTIGINEQQGVQTIAKYLDKKH